METVREGRIIIHLETGKVELKAPQLDAILKAREAELAIVQRIAAEEAKMAAVRAQQAQAAGMGGGIGGGGSRGGAPDSGTWAAYNQHIEKAHDSQMKALRGAQQMGEGFFRLGRAAILLGASSDESFAKMIRGLAQVQAYFDLFKGTIQIVRGMNAALEAMAKAQQSVNAAQAIAKSMGMGELYSKASISAAAFAAKLGPVGVAIAAIIVALLASVAAWDAFTTSEEEAAEAAKRAAAAFREFNQGQIDKLRPALDMAERLSAAYREAADAQGKMTELERLAGAYHESAREFESEGEMYPGEGAIPHLNFAFELYEKEIAALKEIDALKKSALQDELRLRDAKIEQIEKQERLIDSARQQLEIEQQKLQSFQAQFGRLSAIEQQQLKDIRDKLRAGQDTTRQERDFFAQNTGERGRGVIDTIDAKDGAAAGGGADFFDGLAGAGDGLKDAAASLADVVKALEKLTDGTTAAEAKAKLEQEKKALEAQYADFYKKNSEAIKKLADAMNLLVRKIADIEEGLRNGG